MGSGPLDVLVVGSTPLAGLLAGLLATVHGKSVCLLSETISAFRLSRGFDLSVGVMTRPQSWLLLSKTVPETVRAVGKMGARQALVHLDPTVIADSEESADALAHMRQIAIGNGHAVGRAALGGSWGGSLGIVLNDATMLIRKSFEAFVTPWLKSSGVLLLPAAATQLTLRRDGSGRLEHEGVIHNAVEVVLADDAAILMHMGRDAVAGVLTPMAITALQTERIRTLPSRFIDFVDRGVQLHQAAGQVTALALGASEPALGRLRQCLAPFAPVRRAGQVTFHQLASRDGAPVVGMPKGSRIKVVAGLGQTGFFLAPSLARLLSGSATELETAFFAERTAHADHRKPSVSDYRSPAAIGEAA